MMPIRNPAAVDRGRARGACARAADVVLSARLAHRAGTARRHGDEQEFLRLRGSGQQCRHHHGSRCRPTPIAELERAITAEALEEAGHDAGEARRRDACVRQGLAGHRPAGDREDVELRKWILLAGTPTLTALVTAQVPGAAPRPPIRTPRCAPRSAASPCARPFRSTSSSACCRSRSASWPASASAECARRPRRRCSAIGGALGTPAPGAGVEPAYLRRDRARADRRWPADRESFRARRVRQLSEYQGRAHHRLGAAADQRPARPPDHGQREGRHRAPTSSRSCNGCASAAAPICRWSASRAPTPGSTPIARFRAGARRHRARAA